MERTDTSWLMFNFLHIFIIKHILAIVHCLYRNPKDMNFSLFCGFAETEISNKPEVFPRDRIFKVGSRVTFCCIVPKGGDSPKMFLSEYNDSNMNITKISSQTYTLTVDLNQASPSSSGTDVFCETSQEMNGACAYIGCKYNKCRSLLFWRYEFLINTGSCFSFFLLISDAPFDSDLQCETRKLHSVECQWKVGDTRLYRNQTTYHLEGYKTVSTAELSVSQSGLTQNIDDSFVATNLIETDDTHVE